MRLSFQNAWEAVRAWTDANSTVLLVALGLATFIILVAGFVMSYQGKALRFLAWGAAFVLGLWFFVILWKIARRAWLWFWRRRECAKGRRKIRLLSVGVVEDNLLENSDFSNPPEIPSGPAEAGKWTQTGINGDPIGDYKEYVDCVLDQKVWLVGTHAVRCRTTKRGEQWCGPVQRINAENLRARKIAIEVRSMAEDVSGEKDADYSLYIDAQSNSHPIPPKVLSFETGTHGWHHAVDSWDVPPEARWLYVHCILRGHTGTAWFDNISIRTL